MTHHHVEFLHITLHLLHAVVYIVEGCETNVTTHLCPRRYLVDGSFRTCNLGRLHRGGCGKMVAFLIKVLRYRGGRTRAEEVAGEEE